MTHLSVRQASLVDLDALVPLFDAYRQFYGQPADLAGARQFLLDRLNRSDSVIYLACQDGVPVGFTQLYPSFSSVSMARIWILNDLYVTEFGRQKGVAKALISTATVYGRTAGAVRLTLSTAITNVPAQNLYQAIGWKRDEQFFYYHYALAA